MNYKNKRDILDFIFQKTEIDYYHRYYNHFFWRDDEAESKYFYNLTELNNWEYENGINYSYLPSGFVDIDSISPERKRNSIISTVLGELKELERPTTIENIAKFK
jgi:hypothetical protein